MCRVYVLSWSKRMRIIANVNVMLVITIVIITIMTIESGELAR